MITIVEGRLAFPGALFHAKQFDGAGPFTYSATVLVDPASTFAKTVQANIFRLADETWTPEKSPAVLKTILGNNQKCCWYPGDLKAYDGFPGMMVLSGKRKEKDGPPKIVARNPAIPIVESEGKLYAGCYVRLKVDLWAQKNQYGNGIRSTFIALQFLADGEPFSSGGPATTDGFADESAGDEPETSGLI